MSLVHLLWDPLPDSLLAPAPRRSPLRRARAAASVPSQDLAELRVRRGAAQAVVRAAYLSAVAEQDGFHRPPGPFAQAWREHLAGLLDQDSIELPGWGPVAIAADLDTGLAWDLYAQACRARSNTISQAAATASQPVRRGQRVPTFQFSASSDDTTLGEVIYGTCEPCRVGLLYKITFSPDWQFCGLGRMALSQLEHRHPDLTWYTTGQLGHARGFYDRYRRDSASPWTMSQHPCHHFR